MVGAKDRNSLGKGNVVDRETGPDEEIYPVPVDDINALCCGLKDAHTDFKNADDGGRAGVIKALGWTISFLKKFETVDEGNLVTPLVVLASALEALDKSNVQPLLDPLPGLDNRPRGGGVRVAVKALAVYTVTGLTASGIKPKDAYEDVAKVLNKGEIKSLGSKDPINAKTVQNWKKKISVGTDKELSRAFWKFQNSEATDLRNKMEKRGSATVMLNTLSLFISLNRARDAR